MIPPGPVVSSPATPPGEPCRDVEQHVAHVYRSRATDWLIDQHCPGIEAPPATPPGGEWAVQQWAALVRFHGECVHIGPVDRASLASLADWLDALAAPSPASPAWADEMEQHRPADDPQGRARFAAIEAFWRHPQANSLGYRGNAIMAAVDAAAPFILAAAPPASPAETREGREALLLGLVDSWRRQRESLRSRATGREELAEADTLSLCAGELEAVLAASPAVSLPGEAPHGHEWEVEYLPDPQAAGGVVRSGDLVCRDCSENRPDAPEPSDEPDEDAVDALENALVEYDERGHLFGTSGAGAYFLASFLVERGYTLAPSLPGEQPGGERAAKAAAWQEGYACGWEDADIGNAGTPQELPNPYRTGPALPVERAAQEGE